MLGDKEYGNIKILSNCECATKQSAYLPSINAQNPN